MTLEGEELDDDDELVEIESITSVLRDTEVVDGVLTRVVEERESEDGELVEVSRNFVAVCRETGDVWYFGEDVDDYEDGVVVGHGGEWRAGVGGASAGILMPGNPILGARYSQEVAPGVAQDRGEIVAKGGQVTIPAGTFGNVLEVRDTDALDPDSVNRKIYAPGLGNIIDDELELVSVSMPACIPDATTHCLADGRFKVEAEWRDSQDRVGDAAAVLPTGVSGEFWFFGAENTELLVKVIDACDSPFDSFWVFAAGLTNVGVTLSVTDTVTGDEKVYSNPLGADFLPVLDTSAFATCP